MMASTRNLLFLLLLLSVLTAKAAQAASITVDAGGTCTLADAITAANTDAAAGGCPAGSGADTITLAKDIVLTADLPQISSTITIEGANHFISGNNNANVGSVLQIANTGNLTLNEATVKNGGGSGWSKGGGIYNSGTVTLINSNVSGNKAYLNGGGIYNSGTVTLTHSTVSDNNILYSSPYIDYNIGGSGGGIYNIGTVTLTQSTVNYNTISSSNDVTFNSNYLSVTFSCGGGIYNDGIVTLAQSTVSYNKISSSSSILPSIYPDLETNAYSNSYGGGIYNGSSGTVSLINSTISGNTAFSSSNYADDTTSFSGGGGT